MKKIIFVLFAVFASATVKAQIVDNLEYPKFHMGVRGAFTSNTISTTDIYGKELDTESLPFASLGLAMDFRIASLPIYLETGLYYTNKGFKSGGETYDNHGLTMPLLASYHLYLNDNMSVQPFVGPYVGYGIDEEDFQGGLRTGVGFNFGRLYANVGYDFGLNIKDVRQNTLFVTVGFNFVGSY